MLSRLAFTPGRLATAFFRPSSCVRFSGNEVGDAKEYKLEPLKINEGPERDLVNFPRYKRPDYPGKVRMGFIPEEWFQFFYNKTGVTGPYVFGIGLTTYLVSKEIYVLEHEFYTGISIVIMVAYVIKKFGPAIANYLGKEVDAVENMFKNTRNLSISNLEKGIENEKKSQAEAKAMKILFDAKRENIALQIESAFRDRQVHVYQAVKKRLDYQLEKINSERRLEHKHMVNWIINNVLKSITTQQEKEALQKCISDLKLMSTKAKAM